jgi:putative ABC transport system permease protein
VSATSGAPFDLATASTDIEVEGATVAGEAAKSPSEYRVVMPDYFETVGIPVLAGRAITAADRTGGPRNIVVNAALARTSWPNESAVGKRVRYDDDWHTVVGVVGDIRNAGLDAEPQAMFYVSAFQEQPVTSRLVIRSRLGAEELAREVRRVITSVAPGVPITAIDGMPALVSRSIAEPRYRAVLISLFGILAGVLAAVGVYGVTARAVAQKSREIGIRMALGATAERVVQLFVSRTMADVASGGALGIVGAYAGSRLLAPYLFGISPTDPVTFGGVLVLLAAVGLGASWIPARVAARTNPATVLRRG